MQPATIFLDFCDLGARASKTEHWLLTVLRERFDVRVTTAPDFIVYGDGGDVHRMYSCHKIYLGSSEPDFSQCDYALRIGNGKWKLENGKVLEFSAADKTNGISDVDKEKVLAFFQQIFTTTTPPVAAKRRLLGRWLLVRRKRTIPL